MVCVAHELFLHRAWKGQRVPTEADRVAKTGHTQASVRESCAFSGRDCSEGAGPRQPADHTNCCRDSRSARNLGEVPWWNTLPRCPGVCCRTQHRRCCCHRRRRRRRRSTGGHSSRATARRVSHQVVGTKASRRGDGERPTTPDSTIDSTGTRTRGARTAPGARRREGEGAARPHRFGRVCGCSGGD